MSLFKSVISAVNPFRQSPSASVDHGQVWAEAAAGQATESPQSADVARSVASYGVTHTDSGTATTAQSDNPTYVTLIGGKRCTWSPADGDFPAGIDKSYARRDYLDNTLPDKTRSDRDAKVKALRDIGAHIIRLQNAPPAPVIDANALASVHPVKLAKNRLKKHAELLPAYEAIVAVPIEQYKFEPFPTQFDEIKFVLSTMPEIRAAVSKAVWHLAAYGKFILESHGMLNPRDRIEEIRQEMVKIENPVKAEELLREMQVLSSTDARNLFGNFKGIAHERFSPARAAIREVVICCQLAASTGRLNAIDAELEFFENNGNHPWQPTIVSKRYDGVTAELEHHRKSIESAHSHDALPRIENTPLTFFGITSIC